jgi:hypothetical protein
MWMMNLSSMSLMYGVGVVLTRSRVAEGVVEPVIYGKVGGTDIQTLLMAT